MKIHSILILCMVALSCSRKRQVDIPVAATPASPDFKKAEYFNDSTDRKDSAFYYFNEVAKGSKDSLLAALAYTYMAFIQHDAGDYAGTQETALAGIKLLNERTPDQAYSLSTLYNSLGRSSLGLRNYDAAIGQFIEAIRLQPYDAYKNTALNNLAVAYRDNGDYPNALRIMDSIRVQPDEVAGDRARRITNKASLQWRAEPGYDPVPVLHEALTIRIREEDGFGITSSFRHLSDYYLDRRTDSGLIYARRMLDWSKKTGSTEDELDALKKLTSVAPLAESRELFQRYETLSDSVRNAESAARNQFAVIRYESEKSKAQNLLLQEDNQIKSLEILNQRIMVIATIVIAAVLVFFFVLIYRRKKQEAEHRAQVAIKEHQLTMSQKIHDSVANGLYRMMNEIEYDDRLDKDVLLDKIEDLYERSRDLSYEDVSEGPSPSQRIDALLASFATPRVKISAVGNEEAIWHDVPAGMVKELEEILQELLVNMRKHSQAQRVVLNFKRSGEQLRINYKDDGRGFPAELHKGNGLRNTENRMEKIGGEISFTAGTGKGAEVMLTVPINKR